MHLYTGFVGVRYVPFGGIPSDIPNPGWFGEHVVYAHTGEHLSAYCHFWLESWPAKIGEYDLDSRKDCDALQAWIWPNGAIGKVQRKWNPSPNPYCPAT